MPQDRLSLLFQATFTFRASVGCFKAMSHWTLARQPSDPKASLGLLASLYLLKEPNGPAKIRDMIRDDIHGALSRGDKDLASELLMVLRQRREARHLSLMSVPSRSAAVRLCICTRVTRPSPPVMLLKSKPALSLHYRNPPTTTPLPTSPQPAPISVAGCIENLGYGRHVRRAFLNFTWHVCR